jgi:hypothetical protein
LQQGFGQVGAVALSLPISGRLGVPHPLAHRLRWRPGPVPASGSDAARAGAQNR